VAHFQLNSLFVLYCPQCGTEYREGYSSCSDCHVLLTREHPPSDNRKTSLDDRPEPGDPNKDPFTDFWRGEDPRIHAELCSLLDEAEIPHITIRREDHLFNLTRQPQLQIAVPFSTMEKAESAVAEAFGQPLELPLSSEGAVVSDEPLSGWRKFLRDGFERGLLPAILAKMREPLQNKTENETETETEAQSQRDATVQEPDEWYLEDATTEVWSGKEQELAEMICASLIENEIHSRNDELKGTWLVLVQPKDEVRAREIIREIVEATPPE
jgi:hypothetical protein